jgi:hypothetical protein
MLVVARVVGNVGDVKLFGVTNKSLIQVFSLPCEKLIGDTMYNNLNSLPFGCRKGS